MGMRYFTSIGPGPGFFPFWLGVILGLLGLAMIIVATVSVPEPLPDDFAPEEGGVRRLSTVIGAIAGVALMLETLGFGLSLAIVIPFLLITLEQRNPLIIAIITLLGSFGTNYVFTRWLNVPLPRGILGL
jgi:putative tricarboxylic transport membrane protein